jgi:hypothetical protein
MIWKRLDSWNALIVPSYESNHDGIEGTQTCTAKWLPYHGAEGEKSRGLGLADGCARICLLDARAHVCSSGNIFGLMHSLERSWPAYLQEKTSQELQTPTSTGTAPNSFHFSSENWPHSRKLSSAHPHPCMDTSVAACKSHSLIRMIVDELSHRYDRSGLVSANSALVVSRFPTNQLTDLDWYSWCRSYNLVVRGFDLAGAITCYGWWKGIGRTSRTTAWKGGGVVVAGGWWTDAITWLSATSPN